MAVTVGWESADEIPDTPLSLYYSIGEGEVGLSVLSRVSMVIWSLLGGVFLVFHRQEAREAIRESEESRFSE